MKKIILSLLVILLLASPWFMGMRARAQIEELVLKLDEIPGYAASMEMQQSGYLRSRAVLHIGIDNDFLTTGMSPEEKAEFLAAFAFFGSMAVNVDMRHGPILASEERFLGALAIALSPADNPAMADRLGELTVMDGTASTRASFGFTGRGDAVVHVPSMQLQVPDGDMTIGGLDYHINLENWGRVFDGAGQLHAITGTMEGVALDMAPITLKAKGDMGESFMFWTGDVRLASDGLEISGATDFSMQDLQMAMVSSSPEPGKLDGSYQLDIAHLSGSFLPQAVEDLRWHFSMRNMDQAALSELMELLSGSNIEDLQPMFVQLDKVYGNGTEFRLDSFGYRYGPDADLDVSGTLSIREPVFVALTDPATTDHNAILMAALDLSVSLDMSRSMLDMLIEFGLQSQMAEMDMPPELIQDLVEQQQLQLAMMIPELTRSGMLRATGRGLQADLSLRAGELTVNDIAVPLPPL